MDVPDLPGPAIHLPFKLLPLDNDLPKSSRSGPIVACHLLLITLEHIA
jgi:hypothetical protein